MLAGFAAVLLGGQQARVARAFVHTATKIGVVRRPVGSRSLATPSRLQSGKCICMLLGNGVDPVASRNLRDPWLARSRARGGCGCRGAQGGRASVEYVRDIGGGAGGDYHHTAESAEVSCEANKEM